MESFETWELTATDEIMLQGIEQHTIRMSGSNFVDAVSRTDLCQCMGLNEIITDFNFTFNIEFEK